MVARRRRTVTSAGPEERGAIRKEPGGRLGVALVYPNLHRLGMANLGVHAVYRLLNAHPDVRCERAFLPEGGGEPRTVESGSPLRAFDVVAFSLSFEDDHANVLRLLAGAGIPLRAARRDGSNPLVVAGGIAIQINPEPVAPFFDALLVGEGEALLPPFLDALRASRGSISPTCAASRPRGRSTRPARRSGTSTSRRSRAAACGVAGSAPRGSSSARTARWTSRPSSARRAKGSRAASAWGSSGRPRATTLGSTRSPPRSRARAGPSARRHCAWMRSGRSSHGGWR